MLSRLLITMAFILLPCGLTVAENTIRVAGSSTVLPILVDAANHYQQLHPETTITVSGGGSGTGISSAINGIVDIGMTSRKLTALERDQIGEQFETIDLARDAVAVAVSKAVVESGVDSLSVAQIADIYRGKIKNWKDVGGFDKPILVIDKEPSRGTRHVFAEVILGDAAARAPGATIVTGSNNEERSIIARSDQAIGMLSFAWLNDDARGLPIKLADGALTTPTRENIFNGTYPIQRSLSILVAKQRSDDLQRFLDFLRSSSIIPVIEKNGYLPLN